MQAPENAREIVVIELIRAALGRGKLETTGRRHESNVIEFPKRPVERPSVDGAAAPLRAKIAASLAAVGLVLLLGWMTKAALFDRVVNTTASEWRTHTLSDGTTVSIGPRSRLSFEFRDAHRIVRLFGGEALFNVAKDPRRPFIVDADTAVVRAVGTQFGVSRYDGKVTVTVAEGRVAVWRGGQYQIEQSGRGTDTGGSNAEVGTSGHVFTSGTGLIVVAGEQVSLSRTEPVAVKQVNATHELAWAHKQLIFDNDTLEEAVQEFNRRNWMQIKVVDWGIAARPVYGTFDADDPASFIDVLRVKPPIVVVRERPGLLRIERQDEVGDTS